jgi:hypothetical protein
MLLLSGLLLGLGIIIRISSITAFAVSFSYVIMGIGVIGIVLVLILENQ